VDEQQVSWLVVEPGWTVVAADGSEVGYVQEVAGDEGKDIFDGIVLSTSLFREPRYVPAEKVGRIFQGRVQLAVDSNDVKQLEGFLEPPPSLELEADKASWSDRVLQDVAPARETAKAVPFWKRAWVWLLSKRRGAGP
jgi:hypothetical protein